MTLSNTHRINSTSAAIIF